MMAHDVEDYIFCIFRVEMRKEAGGGREGS
jgi:hypothetical protein